MQRLDPQTIKAGPLFYFDAFEQYEARAAKPLIESLRKTFPGCEIYCNAGKAGQSTVHLAKVKGWLGEPDVTLGEIDWEHIKKRASPAVRFNIPMNFSAVSVDLRPLDCHIEPVEGGYYVRVNPELIKFDVRTPVDEVKKRELRGVMGITPERFTVVAASVHSSVGYNDEALTIKGWAQTLRILQEEGLKTPLTVVIAPRDLNPKTMAEADEAFSKTGYSLLSKLRDGTARPPQRGIHIVVADTFGELPELYSIANMAVVEGHHNIIEPAEQGAGVVYSKRNSSFPKAVEGLVRVGGGIALDGLVPHMVATIIGSMMHYRVDCAEMGEKARGYKQENAGAAERIVTRLRQTLEQDNRPRQMSKKLLG